MVDKKHDKIDEDKDEIVTENEVDSEEKNNKDEFTEAADEEEFVLDEEIEKEDNLKDKLKKLQQKVKNLDLEKKNTLEELQRNKADFLNAKKRYEEDRKSAIERANIDFIESLLPVCDSFQMAMGNTEVWEQVDEKWRKGVEGIRMQLDAVLDRYSVKKIVPENQEFDPQKHEAISEEAVENESDNGKVIQVVQAGYQMEISEKETLIRPARVVVGKYEGNK